MLPKCIELSRTKPEKADIVDEHQRDLQNRIVGVRFTTFESEFTLATPHNVFGNKVYNLEPGHYYVVYVDVTRSGTPYGKTKCKKFFTSPVDRDEFITARIKKFWRNRRGKNVAA